MATLSLASVGKVGKQARLLSPFFGRTVILPYMATRLRFGILSTGNIARQFAAGIRQSLRCELVCVGSRSLDTAKAFAAAQQARRAFGSYEQVLADPEVDAIYIGLPNSMHHEWAIRSLRAGKHVLCEKPFAMSAAQSREMFAAADQTGKTLVEAFMYRSHPQTLKVLETIRSGAIGQVRLIRSSFCYKTTKIAGSIRFDAALGGGALMDIGCYCIDFAQLITGAAPGRVNACAHLHESGVDDMTAGTMEFADGTIGTFVCGMTAATNNSAYVCGTEGYIEIPVPWKPPVGAAQFTIAYGIRPRMDGPGAGAAPAGPQIIKVDADRDIYSFEADAFAAAVLDAAPPHMPRQDTLSNMDLLDTLRKQIGVIH